MGEFAVPVSRGKQLRTTRDELCRRAQSNEVIVLDVRPTEEYAGGHIPGAISVPIDELADRIVEIPADQAIVAYCRGATACSPTKRSAYLPPTAATRAVSTTACSNGVWPIFPSPPDAPAACPMTHLERVSI